MKCVRKLPPTRRRHWTWCGPILEREVYEKKKAKEIPAYFTELKQAATPTMLLKGPTPSQRENEIGVQNLIREVQQIQQAGGLQPVPMPKK